MNPSRLLLADVVLLARAALLEKSYRRESRPLSAFRPSSLARFISRVRSPINLCYPFHLGADLLFAFVSGRARSAGAGV